MTSTHPRPPRVVPPDTQVANDLLEGTREPRAMLCFDFTGRRSGPGKAPRAFEEGSTIKESIIRWLEQQL